MHPLCAGDLLLWVVAQNWRPRSAPSGKSPLIILHSTIERTRVITTLELHESLSDSKGCVEDAELA
jgi:hypothetical protein